MITKEDMDELMNIAADYLKTFNLSTDEITGAISLMKNDAVMNGLIKDEITDKEN